MRSALLAAVLATVVTLPALADELGHCEDGRWIPPGDTYFGPVLLDCTPEEWRPWALARVQSHPHVAAAEWSETVANQIHVGIHPAQVSSLDTLHGMICLRAAPALRDHDVVIQVWDWGAALHGRPGAPLLTRGCRP